MDINHIWQILKDNYISDGVLTLPADNKLESPDIKKLIGGAYYTDGKLALKIDGSPAPNGTLTIEGTFQQDILGQKTPESTLTFYVDDQGRAQLAQHIALPDGWRFDATFPALADTAFADLAFAEPGFVLASAKHDDAKGPKLVQGLNFLGRVKLASKPYRDVNWLWSAEGLEALWLGGGLAPGSDRKKDVPTADLATPRTDTGLKIGSVAFNAGLSAAAKPKTDDDKAVDESFAVTSLLDVSDKLKPFALSATIPQSGPAMTLTVGDRDEPLATLDDLAALAGGESLGNQVPSQIPLGDNLRLQSLSVTLSLGEPKKIVSVGLTVALKDVDWTLIPNDVVTLKGLDLTIDLTVVARPPDVSMTLQGHFGIAEQANAHVTVIAPKLIASGAMDQGDELDLMQLVTHFFGTDLPRLDHTLIIDHLTFQLAPKDKTYSLDAGFKTDSWTFDLGPDLPVPSITLEGFKLQAARRQTQTIFDLQADLRFLKNPWTVSASLPGTDAGWVFKAALDAGGEITVKDVTDSLVPKSWGLELPANTNLPRITGLEAAFWTRNRTFEISGDLAWTLTIVEDELVFDIDAHMKLKSDRDSKSDPPKYSGEIGGSFSLNELPLKVTYAFEPNSRKLVFEFQAIKATYVPDPKDPYLRIAFGDKSLGEMLRFMLSLGRPGETANLPAPWNVLNSINLNGLLLELHFKTKELKLLYKIDGGKDLGFIKLDAVGLTYKRQYGKPQVEIQVEGNLLGQAYGENNPLAWNATEGAPPATPGAGSAILDLRYLGFGQHVALRDTAELETVEKVIDALRKAAPPIDDESANPLAQLGSLEFDANSNWLIGADFTVIKTLTLSIVFNDPKVYGLLISLAGPKARNFAGLKFEILYRKVSDSVGVFRIELKLPTVMRTFTTGNMTLTLPVVIIDIYTNGDFKIDMGFPPSLDDFSQSFNIQYFPFIGYGGFYFAKLSGQTSNTVPKVDDGSFQPVIEFGIALSVGVGKTLTLGILSGGISVTVTGMVEGAYAYFEPDDSKLPSANFFLLRGTVAVVGKVYAKVDFGVIKADVNLSVYAGVSLTIEVYEPALIEVTAGVRVSLSVKIVFVRVHFKFDATIHESFKIGEASTPPWHVVSDKSAGRKQLAQQTALRARPPHRQTPAVARSRPRSRFRGLAMPAAAVGDKITIELLVTPAITKARPADLKVPDHPQPPPAAEASDAGEPVISLQLFVETAVDPDAATPEAAARAVGDAEAKGFNQLAKRLFTWAATSIGGEHDQVTAAELSEIFQDLLKPETAEKYFSYAHLDQFLKNNVAFKLKPRPTAGDPASAAFFPMIPALKLAAGDDEFDFGSDRTISKKYEEWIDEYFNDLAVDFANQVERDPDGQGDDGTAQTAPVEETVATYVFRKYFQLLTRGVVQAGLDLLRTFPYEVSDAARTSLASIAAKFPKGELSYAVRAGDSLASIAAAFEVGEAAIENANPNVDFGDLKPGEEIVIPIAVTPARIVIANQTATGILYPWGETQLATGGADADGRERPTLSGIRYQVTAGDTLDSIAKRFGVAPKDLAGANLDTDGLFRNGAEVKAGDLQVTTRDGDTLQSLATYYGVGVDALLKANEDAGIALKAGRKLVVETKSGNESYTVQDGDTLSKIADKQGSTTDSILSLNDAIRVAGGRKIAVKAAALKAGDTVVVHDNTAKGDTLDSILKAFFGKSTDALKQLLRQWNPDVDFGQLEPGTPIEFPYVVTFRNLARYFGVELDTIVAANAGASGVLAQRAAIAVPPIQPEVKADDSFSSLAQRYALSLSRLGELLADCKGIFRDPDKRNGPVELTIAEVPAYGISDLASLLATSGKLNQSAASVSRFLLHGLRLPHCADQSLAEIFGLADRTPADCANIETFPIFAMVGQEFAAPKTELDKFRMKLTNAHGASWVAFEGGDDLTLDLSKDERQQITDFAKTDFDPKVKTSRRLPLVSYVPRRSPLQHRLPWQAGELPGDTCLSDGDQASGEPTLWPLPAALRTAIAEAPGQAVAYRLATGHTKANGRLHSQPVDCALWATTVEISVQRVAGPGGNFLDDTYVVYGADDAGKHRLLDVWLHLNETPGEDAQLFLLYDADPTSDNGKGYLSDGLDRAASGILKANLSTLSHGKPPSGAFAERQALRTRQDAYQASLETAESRAALKLLWEASVVRSGGFYLIYRGGDGLPGRLFADDDTASLTLLVVLKSQGNKTDSKLRAFNNVALVGQNIDPSQVDVFAQPLVHQVAEGDTLAGIASAYKHLSLNAADLAEANARIQGLLEPGAKMAVPDKPDHTIAVGDTFAGVADQAGVDVAALGTANADRAILQPATFVQFMAGELRPAAVVPPGTSGFFLTRDNPEAANPRADRALAAADPQNELDALFNLLGFRVAENDHFTASGEGLPAGPVNSPDDGGDGMSEPAADPEQDKLWRYRRAARISRCAKTNPVPDSATLPAAKGNPYAGIARDARVVFELAFQDLYGNRVTPARDVPKVTAPVGYTDVLIGPARWPASTGAFRFTDDGGASLRLDWSFDPSRYMPSPGGGYALTHNNARVDREHYRRVYYQVAMPDSGFGLDTTMGDVGDVNARLKPALRGFVAQAFVYLDAVAGAAPTTTETGAEAPGDTLAHIAGAYDTSAGAILHANGGVKASALFKGGQKLTLPKTTVAKPGDSIAALASRLGMTTQDLIAALAKYDADVELAPGTAINAAARDYDVPATPSLTVQAISEDEAVRIVDLPGSGPGDPPRVQGLAAANTGAKLHAGTELSLNGTSLAAKDGETLDQFLKRFQEQDPEATLADLVMANRSVARVFAAGQTLALPNYVIQEHDTLGRIAEQVGPPADAQGDDAVARLLAANSAIPDVFPAGKPLIVGTEKAVLPAGKTLDDLGTEFAVSLDTLGRLNAGLTLNAGVKLALPYRLDSASVAQSLFRADGAQSFADVVAAYEGWRVDKLAQTNLHLPALFNPEVTIEIAGKKVTPTLADTFASLAKQFDLDPADFAGKVADTAKLVRPGAVIAAPAMKSRDGETLADAAARYQVAAGVFGGANAAVYGLLKPDQTATVDGDSVKVGKGDTLGTLADAINDKRLARNDAATVDAMAVAAANPKLKLNAVALFPPVAPARVAAPVTPSHDSAIRPVKATLTMHRDTALVDPEFKDAEDVFRATAELAAQPIADDGHDSAAETRNLQGFARDFEAALPGFKLATGADRGTRGDARRWACGQSDSTVGETRLAERQAGAKSRQDRHLWAVNFGTEGPKDKRFNYSIDRDGLRFFALPPLSTELWQARKVEVDDYVSGQGIQGKTTLNFHGVDVDQWARAFYDTLDRVLSPDYAAAIHALDLGDGDGDGADHFHDLVQAKSDIARNLKTMVEPILKDDAKDTDRGLEEAKEALYQQLLVELSAAYTTDAIVQAPFDVRSACANANTAARLSGKPVGQRVRVDDKAAASIEALAAHLGIAAPYVATVIQDQRYILRPDTKLACGGKTYTTTRSDTLASVASALGTEVSELPGKLEVKTPKATLFRPRAVLNVVALGHALAADDTFAGIADGLSITVERLVAANAGLAGVFKAGSEIAVAGNAVKVAKDDTLLKLSDKLGFHSLRAFVDALWAGDLNRSSRYTLKAGSVLRVLRLVPVYSFTTGKLALADGRNEVSFLIDVKDLAANRSIYLDLDYAVTEMEYDIVERQEAIGDYQDSSWLSFILPMPSAPSKTLPNDSRIGQVDIPLPLRSYPALPTIADQKAEAVQGEGTRTLFDWTYKFTMRRQTAAQDTMTVDATYNVASDTGKASLSETLERDRLYRALAAFATARPALEDDLAHLVDPAATAEQKKAGKVAVRAFATYAKAVAAAFDSPAQLAAAADDGDVYAYGLRPIVSEEQRDAFGYLMLTYDRGEPDFLFETPAGSSDAFVKALDGGRVPDALAKLFQAAGFPLSDDRRVDVVEKGELWRAVDNGNAATYRLKLAKPAQGDGKAIKVYREYLWPKLYDRADGDRAAGRKLDARQIGDRLLVPYEHKVARPVELRFAFDKLNLMNKQNAWGGTEVARNAALIAGKATNPSFVYRTKQTMFPSKVTPYIVRDEAVSLRDYAAGDADLATALGGFFGALFSPILEAGSAGTSGIKTRNIKVTASYSYTLAEAGEDGDEPLAARFPLTLVPLHAFKIGTDSQPGGESFVTRLAKAVDTARQRAGAAARPGTRYDFEIAVYSTLDGQNAGQPLLSLTNLYYELPEGAL